MCLTSVGCLGRERVEAQCPLLSLRTGEERGRLAVVVTVVVTVVVMVVAMVAVLRLLQRLLLLGRVGLHQGVRGGCLKGSKVADLFSI
jgi:hypothetical protein